uniref:Uncharacterized protein n=1 Tax=Arundo donax TaxID=35708 RepID=A0A0A9HIQ9_ARUDO
MSHIICTVTAFYILVWLVVCLTVGFFSVHHFTVIYYYEPPLNFYMARQVLEKYITIPPPYYFEALTVPSHLSAECCI